ncbi:MAG: hypothetical protein E7203_12845 [Selenomonas ruminantium]|jgi:membrane protein YdbS with pleckstrin-like domain|uniref:Uncharacterized protein n=1 Tax=Selenomonas ruminantium TaxID=971 RepID=A0A927ZWA6_SELRU|nr:hypothetical protein [Selenomonas ruminantium]MBE6086310.1 hypothetical protein [Selenomonas ruminantium]
MIWAILVFILTVVVTNIVSSALGLLGKIIVGVILIFVGIKLWAPAAIAVILGVIVGTITGAGRN